MRISAASASALPLASFSCFSAVAAGAFYLRQPAALWATLLGDAGGLSLPEHPAIAVLPFDDMSATHDQQYLADGITEELITGLAKFPELLVMARNSTFTYKDKPTDVRQVGKDLNVRYVVEGSIQRSDQNVRVTAQLIDASTGRQLWADRYDRQITTSSQFATTSRNPSPEHSGGCTANWLKPRSHACPGKIRIASLPTITL